MKRVLLILVVVVLVVLALWSTLTGTGATDSEEPTKFYSVLPHGRPGPVVPGPDDIPELEIHLVWEGAPPFPDLPNPRP